MINTLPISDDGVLGEMLVAIREDMRALPYVRSVPDSIPDSLNVFPSVLVYPGAMSWKLGSHSGDRGKPMALGMCTFVVDLVILRKDLPREIGRLSAFASSVPMMLIRGFKTDRYGGPAVVLGNPSLAQNATWPIRGQIVSGEWGDNQTIDLEIQVDVTVNEEINV